MTSVVVHAFIKSYLVLAFANVFVFKEAITLKMLTTTSMTSIRYLGGRYCTFLTVSQRVEKRLYFSLDGRTLCICERSLFYILVMSSFKFTICRHSSGIFEELILNPFLVEWKSCILFLCPYLGLTLNEYQTIKRVI